MIKTTAPEKEEDSGREGPGRVRLRLYFSFVFLFSFSSFFFSFFSLLGSLGEREKGVPCYDRLCRSGPG